jgi:hypothetical protein
MAIVRTGDWAKLNRVLNPALLKKSLNKFGTVATNRAGLLVVRNIRKHMRKVSSPPLHDITKDRKGSSKPLMDEGTLFGAITHIPLSPFIAFVGVPQNRFDKESGVSLAVIARVLEGGQVGEIPKETIIVRKRAAALFVPLKRKVRPNDPNLVRGEDFVLMNRVRIRPRPFVGPGVKASEKGVLLIYEQATRAAFLSLMR